MEYGNQKTNDVVKESGMGVASVVLSLVTYAAVITAFVTIFYQISNSI